MREQRPSDGLVVVSLFYGGIIDGGDGIIREVTNAWEGTEVLKVDGQAIVPIAFKV